MTLPRFAPRRYRNHARDRARLAEDAGLAVAALEPLVVEARRAMCAPPLATVFLDPLSRERIAYADTEWDRRGVALVGVCFDYVWVGTEYAVLVVDGGELCFELWGMLGAQLWRCCLAARDEDAARAYADRVGAGDVNIDGLAFDAADLE